jgi:hypothetical protein
VVLGVAARSGVWRGNDRNHFLVWSVGVGELEGSVVEFLAADLI